MATETLHFENARVAQQLFANEPRNLESLSETLGVKATSREGWIKLDGAAENVERAKHLFQLLETSLRGGSAIRTRDFSQALNVIKGEGVDALRDLYAERINTSTRKAHVTPKTTGQRKNLTVLLPTRIDEDTAAAVDRVARRIGVKPATWVRMQILEGLKNAGGRK